MYSNKHFINVTFALSFCRMCLKADYVFFVQHLKKAKQNLTAFQHKWAIETGVFFYFS